MHAKSIRIGATYLLDSTEITLSLFSLFTIYYKLLNSFINRQDMFLCRFPIYFSESVLI